MPTLRETFHNIADAIRTRGDIEDQMTPLEMPDKISSIEGSSGKYGLTIQSMLGSVNEAGQVIFPDKRETFYSEEIINIGDYILYGKFQRKPTLYAIHLPNLKSIGQQGLYQGCQYCHNLEIVNLPNLQTLGTRSLYYAFRECTNLKKVYMPKLSTTTTNSLSYAFSYCTNLQFVDFSEAENVFPFSSNMFANQGENQYKIIVPDALYDDWVTSWSTVSTHIVKKSEFSEGI